MLLDKELTVAVVVLDRFRPFLSVDGDRNSWLECIRTSFLPVSRAVGLLLYSRSSTVVRRLIIRLGEKLKKKNRPGILLDI